MPLYEYQCSKCGHQFEVIQKYSDPPQRKCPKCKGPLEKLLSAPAIQFKGTGWYVTDYGKKGGAEKPSDKPAAGDAGQNTAKEGPKAGAKDKERAK